MTAAGTAGPDPQRHFSPAAQSNSLHHEMPAGRNLDARSPVMRYRTFCLLPLAAALLAIMKKQPNSARRWI